MKEDEEEEEKGCEDRGRTKSSYMQYCPWRLLAFLQCKMGINNLSALM